MLRTPKGRHVAGSGAPTGDDTPAPAEADSLVGAVAEPGSVLQEDAPPKRRQRKQSDTASDAPTATSPEASASRGQRLGELLLRDNGVDADQLAMALADQAASGRRLGQLLLDRGLITDTALARALAERLGLPLADLGSAVLDSDTAALLPESVAREAQAIPLGDTEGMVNVALADPTDEARAAVLKSLGRETTFSLA